MSFVQYLDSYGLVVFCNAPRSNIIKPFKQCALGNSISFLIGEYKGYRECHITPDWLLIYRVKNDHSIELLELTRTGSHSDLFK